MCELSSIRIVMSDVAFLRFRKLVENYISIYKNKYLDEFENELLFELNLMNEITFYKHMVSEKQVQFGWDGIVWYYPADYVKAIMESLKQLKKEGYGYNYIEFSEFSRSCKRKSAKPTEKDEVIKLIVPMFDYH